MLPPPKVPSLSKFYRRQEPASHGRETIRRISTSFHHLLACFTRTYPDELSARARRFACEVRKARRHCPLLRARRVSTEQGWAATVPSRTPCRFSWSPAAT